MWSSDRQSSQSSRQSRRSFLYVGALGWALVVMVGGWAGPDCGRAAPRR
jgi:hypothetical protein